VFGVPQIFLGLRHVDLGAALGLIGEHSHVIVEDLYEVILERLAETIIGRCDVGEHSDVAVLARDLRAHDVVLAVKKGVAVMELI